jgi:2-haloacid dehalogenase
MTASTRHVPLTETDQERVLNGMLLLPAHADVSASLTRLKEAGFRLATLTNSTARVLQEQLQNAALEQFFEKNLSVDEIQRYKPAPQTYHMAAVELRVAVDEMCLVSAHPWDVLGAMRAGYRAAFLARRGQIFYPLAKNPNIVGADLHAVGGKILSQEFT